LITPISQPKQGWHIPEARGRRINSVFNSAGITKTQDPHDKTQDSNPTSRRAGLVDNATANRALGHNLIGI
ncbi:hypothetical protein J6590_040073, partial [Homalodisca vitripennis]